MMTHCNISQRFENKLKCKKISSSCSRKAVQRTASQSQNNSIKPRSKRDGNDEAISRLRSFAAAALYSASLLLSPIQASAGEIIRLPASSDPAVFQAQRTLVEVWSIVGESFVDQEFNHHDWTDELREHMLAAYIAGSGDAAYEELSSMLNDLGDPYTRRMPPSEYRAFRVSMDGELQGIGLLIATEPAKGKLVVLAPIAGGPADRAGVKAGDEVVAVDGVSTEGWDGQRAAAVLRGPGGTDVTVRLARRTEGIPGVAGRPEAPPVVITREVRLKRERVQLSPLYYTVLRFPQNLIRNASHSDLIAAADAEINKVSSDVDSAVAEGQTPELYAMGVGRIGTASPKNWGARDSGDEEVGYIRLSSFSNNASEEMRKALLELEARGVNSYILDLRNNTGGLVSASIEVASLFLEGNPVVFNIESRAASTAQTVERDDWDLSMAGPVTKAPLTVLVNESTASASEILSGALHDNHRATIIGDQNTYGKGRIQSVFELSDGSALALTVAKYVTPNGTVIDKKGIQPDLACSPDSLTVATGAESSGGGSGKPALPVGLVSSAMIEEELSRDGCVLAAEKLLGKQVSGIRI